MNTTSNFFPINSRKKNSIVFLLQNTYLFRSVLILLLFLSSLYHANDGKISFVTTNKELLFVEGDVIVFDQNKINNDTKIIAHSPKINKKTFKKLSEKSIQKKLYYNYIEKKHHSLYNISHSTYWSEISHQLFKSSLIKPTNNQKQILTLSKEAVLVFSDFIVSIKQFQAERDIVLGVLSGFTTRPPPLFS